MRQIADSYGLTNYDLLQAFLSGENIPTLKGRWGWLKLLLEANQGSTVWVGSPATFPPFLDESSHEMLSLQNGQIVIGRYSLAGFTNHVLDLPMNPVIYWRNTKPTHYYLGGREYLDASRPRDLPDFRIVSADLLFLIPGVGQLINFVFDVGFAGVIDRYGNVYVAGFVGPAPGINAPISFGEGYIANNPSQIGQQVRGLGSIPQEQSVINTIRGWCVTGSFVVLTPHLHATVCQNQGTTFTYGYSLGIGASVTLSYTGGPWKVSGLAWHYIDEKPGVSQQDVYQMLLASDCE